METFWYGVQKQHGKQVAEKDMLEGMALVGGGVILYN